jgi:hypothetical protein
VHARWGHESGSGNEFAEPAVEAPHAGLMRQEMNGIRRDILRQQTQTSLSTPHAEPLPFRSNAL